MHHQKSFTVQGMAGWRDRTWLNFIETIFYRFVVNLTKQLSFQKLSTATVASAAASFISKKKNLVSGVCSIFFNLRDSF